VTRYALLVVPGVALLAGTAAVRVRARHLAIAVVLTAAVANAGIVLARGASYRPENWRQAQSFVHTMALPGDGIIFAPTYTAVSFEYYQLLSRARAPEPILPNGQWDDLSVVFGKAPPDSRQLVTANSEAVRGRDRVWLMRVSTHSKYFTACSRCSPSTTRLKAHEPSAALMPLCGHVQPNLGAHDPNARRLLPVRTDSRMQRSRLSLLLRALGQKMQTPEGFD
jgi:hypothetical protein